jgi:hypothetical protein
MAVLSKPDNYRNTSTDKRYPFLLSQSPGWLTPESREGKSFSGSKVKYLQLK